MATTPVRHSNPPTEKVELPAQPPAPDMAPEEKLPDNIPENTRAEMEAGRAALAANQGRTAAEQAAGKKALDDKNPSHSRSHSGE